MKFSGKWKGLADRLARAAKEEDKARRGVRIAAVLSDALADIRVSPILVGGSAVAFYTDGRYATRDIDMICPSGKDVEEIMERLGFSRHGKDYVHERLKIYAEFPGESLGATERIAVIDVDGSHLKIISLEDLIVDRLCAFKFWRSGIDGINVLIMLELGIADRGRIEERAREEDVLDALDYVEDVLEKSTRRKLSPAQASELLQKYHRRRNG